MPHPDSAVAAVLEDASIPRVLVEEAQTVVLKAPNVRFLMERLAGAYLEANAASN